MPAPGPTIEESIVECQISLGYARQLLAQAVAEVTKANSRLDQLLALSDPDEPHD